MRTGSPGATDAADDRAGIAAEIGPAAVDPLHRHAERRGGQGLGGERHAFEMIEQGRPGIPGHRRRARDHIVAAQARDRDRGEGMDADLARLLGEVGDDRVEARAVVIDQVHLADREHDPADAEQMRDLAVPPRLRDHAFARVDEDHGEVGGRCRGHHVAGIILVPRRVGDDEAAPRGGEEEMRDVDRDALFALGGEAIGEQGEIELVALRAVLAGGCGEIARLILEHRAGIVQQPADQGRFAVVDAAAHDQAEQAVGLLARRIAAVGMGQGHATL